MLLFESCWLLFGLFMVVCGWLFLVLIVASCLGVCCFVIVVVVCMCCCCCFLVVRFFVCVVLLSCVMSGDYCLLVVVGC